MSVYLVIFAVTLPLSENRYSSVRRGRRKKMPRLEGTMSRGTGMGLLVFGIVLGIVGAIVRFAVKVRTTGFNNHEGGFILLVVGIATAVVGLVLLTLGGRSRSMTQESVQSTPTGQVRTEERTDAGTGLQYCTLNRATRVHHVRIPSGGRR